MSDIRLSCAFHQHPKTRKVFRRLGAAGPWALVCLFLWARSSRPDGDLSGLSDEDIEIAADWVGAEGQLVSTLVACGFLDGGEAERRIHDWEEHQPWSAGSEDRSERAKWRALVKHHGRDGAAERMPGYAAKLAASTKAASATDDASENTATPQHAASVLVADDSMSADAARSAPLPLPLPYPKSKEEEQRALAEAATAARKAMIEGGIPPTRINQSHPELLKLVANPLATPSMFRDTAREAIDAGESVRNPMTWTIGTIASRLAAAARPGRHSKAANAFARTEEQKYEPGALSQGQIPSWLEQGAESATPAI